MSDVSGKRKRKRVKVECLECGSRFNDDLKKGHEEKLHRGKRVNVKHVGAPKNPFESAAALSQSLKNHEMVQVCICNFFKFCFTSLKNLPLNNIYHMMTFVMYIT